LFDNYCDKPDAFARCLVARLRPETRIFQSIKGNDLCKICAVDYEISPFRSNGQASVEDVGASDGGGLDLLLRDKNSALPIIGKIKAPAISIFFLEPMPGWCMPLN